MIDKCQSFVSRQYVLPLVYGAGLGLVAISLYAFMPDASANQLATAWVLSAVGVSLPAIVAWLNFRANSHFLSQATETVRQYLRGDVESLQLSQSLRGGAGSEFSDVFQQLLNKVSANSQLYGDVAVRLARDAQHISDISGQIADSMQQQVSDTAQVQVTIDELQAAVSMAKDVASNTNQLANKSETEGESGKQVMTEAITGVMMLSASVNEAGEIIRKLGEDSKSIGGIIEVITGVSEQTNLLALNAAIEAARAGEQGRGFAVVADEVRTLAAQTQQSAQKINEIINVLLGHVKDASEVISNSVEQADKSDELMEGVTISYSELVGYMKEISTESNNLLQTTLSSQSSAESAVNSLESIQASSQHTISQTESLISESMELAKMGDQLNIMVGTGTAQTSVPDMKIKKDTNSPVESTNENIELF